MERYFKILVIIIGLILFSSQVVIVKGFTETEIISRDEGVKLFYTVTIEKDKPTFHVSLKAINVDSGEFILDFQVVRLNDFNNYISNLQFRDTTGNLQSTYLGNFAWKVNQSGGTLSIEYDVNKIIPFQPIASRDIGEKEASVYINNEGGIFYGQDVFIKPSFFMESARNVSDIEVKFDLPLGWQLVTPYIDNGEYLKVPKITNLYLCDFVNRSIYFGNMKYYSESKAGNCIIKFGVLKDDESDEADFYLSNEDEVKQCTERVALAVNELEKLFGENPYPVIPVVASFLSPDGWGYPPCIFGEVQYWPPERYDETIGHLYYCWMRETFDAPTGANYLICKGIGESYLGNKLAYKLTGDKHYLGKIYHYCLVYKGAQNTEYSSRYEIHDEYYRGCVIGLWLDKLIQNETGGKKSLEDVNKYLYQKFKNTEHEINIKDLEEAVDIITGQNNSLLYQKYLEGEENIPVDEYMQVYKDDFNEFIKVLATSHDWHKDDYRNYAIPFFVGVEIAMRLPIDLPLSVLILSHCRDFGKYMLKNYEVDNITESKVEAALTRLTGKDCTGFFKQWKDSYGELSLDEMKEWLKSYLPYPPQDVRAAFENNSVVIDWKSVEWRYQSGYYEVIGYAIYRGETPYEGTLIGRVDSSKTIYYDSNIERGKTYYYWVKSIENLFQEFEVLSEPSSVVSVDTGFRISCFPASGGSISPSGTIQVNYGESKTFTITPYSGYKISTVKVDGKSIGPVSSYTFTNITSDHTIEATFEEEKKETVIILQIGDKNFTVNGGTRTLDSPPIIKNGRTLLPIRAVVEALGGTAGWDATERKVTVTLSSTTIELWIGKSIAKVNGIDTPIDATNSKVVPEIINSRTMLPLRFVAENLGCNVQWDGTTKTITIIYNQ